MLAPRWRVKLLVALLVLANLNVFAPPVRAQTGLLTFLLRVPGAVMGGGVWTLSTHIGNDMTLGDLASGVIPPNGSITVSIPTDVASQSDTNMFFLGTQKLSLNNNAPQVWVTGNVEGLTLWEVFYGATVDFGFQQPENPQIYLCTPNCGNEEIDEEIESAAQYVGDQVDSVEQVLRDNLGGTSSSSAPGGGQEVDLGSPAPQIAPVPLDTVPWGEVPSAPVGAPAAPQPVLPQTPPCSAPAAEIPYPGVDVPPGYLDPPPPSVPSGTVPCRSVQRLARTTPGRG